MQSFPEPVGLHTQPRPDPICADCQIWVTLSKLGLTVLPRLLRQYHDTRQGKKLEICEERTARPVRAWLGGEEHII